MPPRVALQAEPLPAVEQIETLLAPLCPGLTGVMLVETGTVRVVSPARPAP